MLEIYQMLSQDSDNVRVIGIYGIDGIGKTTIAKALYNKYSNKYDISCFLENVKQGSQGDSPQFSLYEQMLSKLPGRNAYEVADFESGTGHLEQILCSKKALIVIDDMPQSGRLEMFMLCALLSAGSSIIITTRALSMVSQSIHDISDVYGYRVKGLGRKESLKLFSYHAFGNTKPPKRFRGLSESFVTYANGVPLALKTLGSSLCNRTDEFWIAELKKVQEITEKNRQHILQLSCILQLSYDALHYETEKAIFLNIACFFVRKDKDKVVHFFESHKIFPQVGISVLVERCLLTIDEDNKFQMHDLIQVMGRELAESRQHLLLQGKEWKDFQNLQVIKKHLVIKGSRVRTSPAPRRSSELEREWDDFSKGDQISTMRIAGVPTHWV